MRQGASFSACMSLPPALPQPRQFGLCHADTECGLRLRVRQATRWPAQVLVHNVRLATRLRRMEPSTESESSPTAQLCEPGMGGLPIRRAGTSASVACARWSVRLGAGARGAGMVVRPAARRWGALAPHSGREQYAAPRQRALRHGLGPPEGIAPRHPVGSRVPRISHRSHPGDPVPGTETACKPASIE